MFLIFSVLAAHGQTPKWAATAVSAAACVDAHQYQKALTVVCALWQAVVRHLAMILCAQAVMEGGCESGVLLDALMHDRGLQNACVWLLLVMQAAVSYRVYRAPLELAVSDLVSGG